MKLILKRYDTKPEVLNVEITKEFTMNAMNSQYVNTIQSTFLPKNIILVVDDNYNNNTMQPNVLGITSNVLFMKFDKDLRKFADLNERDIRIILSIIGDADIDELYSEMREIVHG